MNYNFNFNVVFRNIDVFMEGLGLGLFLAAISLTLAIIIGLIIALGAVSNHKTMKKAARVYVTIFRNTPLLILIYIIYFGLPDLGIILSKQIAFILTLSLYGAAYMTEVFRAGLEGIPKGIIEAGYAIGLSRRQIMLDIKLPIMFRSVLPSMGNYLISLFKDTSLAAAIAIPEITYITKKLNVQSFRTFEVWIAAALLYVITSYLMARGLSLLERKWKIK
ncbi:MAG: amino acid ABC transporter permease [Sedimentibacter sp.]